MYSLVACQLPDSRLKGRATRRASLGLGRYDAIAFRAEELEDCITLQTGLVVFAYRLQALRTEQLLAVRTLVEAGTNWASTGGAFRLAAGDRHSPISASGTSEFVPFQDQLARRAHTRSALGATATGRVKIVAANGAGNDASTLFADVKALHGTSALALLDLKLPLASRASISTGRDGRPACRAVGGKYGVTVGAEFAAGCQFKSTYRTREVEPGPAAGALFVVIGRTVSAARTKGLPTGAAEAIFDV
jgi:hypothetical protein